MKNLYEGATATEVKERIARLTPECERQWGTMNAAQAMAHCSGAMEWAVGETTPPRMFVGRIIGQLVKPMVIGNDTPMRRNAPTAKTLIVTNQRDLKNEQNRLCTLIDRFATAGAEKCTAHPHSFFGKLTAEEWAILMYKHLDHHLRQFGV